MKNLINIMDIGCASQKMTIGIDDKSRTNIE